MADRRVNEITEFFRQFNWIAVVRVEACDTSQHLTIMRYTVTRRALDVIKLFLGDHHTRRLRTAEDRGHARRSAKLSRDNDSQLRWSLAATPNDNVIGDNWLSALTQNPQFELAAKALLIVGQGEQKFPLCVRFIDARWHGNGDAISERQVGAKIGETRDRN